MSASPVARPQSAAKPPAKSPPVHYTLNSLYRAALVNARLLTPVALRKIPVNEPVDGPTPQPWVTHRDDDPSVPPKADGGLSKGHLKFRRPWPTLFLNYHDPRKLTH